MVGILLSYWGGLFLGAMLVSGGYTIDFPLQLVQPLKDFHQKKQTSIKNSPLSLPNLYLKKTCLLEMVVEQYKTHIFNVQKKLFVQIHGMGWLYIGSITSLYGCVFLKPSIPSKNQIWIVFLMFTSLLYSPISSTSEVIQMNQSQLQCLGSCQQKWGELRTSKRPLKLLKKGGPKNQC